MISWWLGATTIPSSQLLCRNSKELFIRERGMRTISHGQALKLRHFKTAVFICDSKKFVDQLELISLSQRRSRADIVKMTPGGLTQLRGATGSANWLGNQTRPNLCVSTSLLQGAHASATVLDTREANKLICLCRQHAHVPIRVSPIPLEVIAAGVCVEMDPHKVGVLHLVSMLAPCHD